jgi:hypothetical protein
MKLVLLAVLGIATAVVLMLVVPPVQGACDPSYPTICVAPAPPDLDCANVNARHFPVLPPDPHNFDGDMDGIGCEELPQGRGSGGL